MFHDDDPALTRVRDLALALPGAQEKVSHGRPAFFTTKVFAYYGGSHKVDGDWRQHPQAVMVLLDEDERSALLEEPRSFVPAYLGPSGWLGINLPAPGAEGWAEVAELLDASFRRTAPARLVRELE
ncbi:YjbR protein [Nocardioides psychrotolerans]|uniref:YjbR protein n=2 Tax=Nocardioides psychrotolerans TaxID=1005945 RepID=A0A1I3PLC9_9ACTN|nr:YjbR protein [Nocardioides psychrotolerans]